LTVAYDAFTASSTFTDDASFNHTPVGTPKAVIVWITQTSSGADRIAGVTYGGVAMTEVSGSPVLQTGGEFGAVYCYFLGSSIPTGTQSVSIDTTTTTNNFKACCITLTASADTEIVDVDATINSTSLANPSVTLSLGGRTCFCAIGFYSGQNAVTGVTPLTSWTSREETDRGSQTTGCYTYDTIGTADVTAGWTQTADDAIAIAIAVSEIVTTITTTVTGKETRNKCIRYV
jgi:hypothetical protein